MKRQFLAAASAAMLAGLAQGTAVAQPVETASAPAAGGARDVGVMDRPRPDYDAQGLLWGAFVVLPRLTTTVDFDDNVYATSQKVSDTVLQFQPEVTVRSDWSRNAVEAYARASVNDYLSHGTENTTDVLVRGSGRYDLGEASNLNASAQYGWLTEPRYSTNTTQSVRNPVQYRQGEVHLGGVLALDRVRLVGDVRLDDYRFDNNVDGTGAFVLEQDQDRTEWVESARAEYAYSLDTALFVSGSLNQRTYRLQPPASAFDRDATGFNLAAGARLDLTHLMRGEFQVGYLKEDYSSSVFRSVSGVSLDGRVNFFVTPLTTVVLTADRSVGDAADPRSSGYVTTNGGVEVDHELRRNVILLGRVFYAHDDYHGIDRADDRWSLRVGGNYLINRNLGVSLYVDHIDIASSGVDRLNGYQVNQVLLSLVLQR
jgi:hypothetical protein